MKCFQAASQISPPFREAANHSTAVSSVKAAHSASMAPEMRWQTQDLGAPAEFASVHGRHQTLSAAQKHRRRKMERVWAAGRNFELRKWVHPPPGFEPQPAVSLGRPPPPPPLPPSSDCEPQPDVQPLVPTVDRAQERLAEKQEPPAEQLDEATSQTGRGKNGCRCKAHAAFPWSKTCEIAQLRGTCRSAVGAELWHESASSTRATLVAGLEAFLREIEFRPLQKIFRTHWRFILMIWTFTQEDDRFMDVDFLLEVVASSLLHRSRDKLHVQLCRAYMQIRKPYWTPEWMIQQLQGISF